jgi:hypothetical protein
LSMCEGFSCMLVLIADVMIVRRVFCNLVRIIVSDMKSSANIIYLH